jgi:hypothetical protein
MPPNVTHGLLNKSAKNAKNADRKKNDPEAHVAFLAEQREIVKSQNAPCVF